MSSLSLRYRRVCTSRPLLLYCETIDISLSTENTDKRARYVSMVVCMVPQTSLKINCVSQQRRRQLRTFCGNETRVSQYVGAFRATIQRNPSCKLVSYVWWKFSSQNSCATECCVNGGSVPRINADYWNFWMEYTREKWNSFYRNTLQSVWQSTTDAASGHVLYE